MQHGPQGPRPAIHRDRRARQDLDRGRQLHLARQGVADTARPLILLGLRGSGKTSAGHRAAESLGMTFADLDDATPVLLRCADAAEAISTRGLDAFRDAEARALEQILEDPPGVLALGGGTPTAPGAAEILRAADARLVYLHASIDTLRARLAGTDLTSRPSLTGTPSLDEIDRVYLERDPIYRGLAHHTIDVDDLTIGQTAERLVSFA